MNDLPSGRTHDAVIPFNGGNNEISAHLAPDRAGMSAREAIGVLRRRIWLIIVVALITAAPVVYLVAAEPPSYRATASIRLTDNRGLIAGSLEGAATERTLSRNVDAIRSQLQVLQSSMVLQEVVEQEGLRLSAEGSVWPITFLSDVSIKAEALPKELRLQFSTDGVTAHSGDKQIQAAYGAPIDVEGVRFTVLTAPGLGAAALTVLTPERAVERLTRNLNLQSIDKTDVIRVSYAAADPYLAQRVANRLVGVFQNSSARNAQHQSRLRRSFLEDQLSITDSLLAETRLALGTYRSREQVYSSREKYVEQQQGLLSVAMRREELDAERQMYRSLLNQVEQSQPGYRTTVLRTLVSSPGMGNNPVVAQLYAQLVRHEAVRDSLTTGPSGSTSANPAVERLTVLIDAAEDKLVDAARSHIASLDARAVAVRQLETRTSNELRQLPRTEIEEVRLLQQVESLQRASTTLREELHKARMAEAIETGQVEIVDLAALPLQPDTRLRTMKFVLGIVFGLLLGGGGALALESRSTSFRRREDVERALHLPDLAIIPRAGAAGRNRNFLRVTLRGRINAGAIADHHRADRHLATGASFDEAGFEAYRMLRNKLILSNDKPWKSLVVTSALPGDGKTTTAANLAIAFATQGKRVLLVDCDLRGAKIHRVFQVDREPGMVDVLLRRTTLAESIQRTSVPNLCVLAAGIPALGAINADVLSSDGLRRIMQAASEQFDVVIADSPPLLATADASLLVAVADAVVLVVRAGRTESAIAKIAVQQLSTASARFYGVVINDPDAVIPTSSQNYYYSTVKAK